MPTIKQRLATQRIVENGGNVSRAMLDVKYSPATAKTPQKLTESKGFKQLCDEMGLTDEFLTNALVEDIAEKKGNRKGELELGYKVLGRLNNNEEKGNTYNTLILADEQHLKLLERAARRRGVIVGGGEESLGGFYDSDQPEV